MDIYDDKNAMEKERRRIDAKNRKDTVKLLVSTTCACVVAMILAVTKYTECQNSRMEKMKGMVTAGIDRGHNALQHELHHSTRQHTSPLPSHLSSSV